MNLAACTEFITLYIQLLLPSMLWHCWLDFGL